MKCKQLTILLASVLLFSVAAVAFAATCSRCQGTGKITEQETCPTCHGVSSSTSTIRKTGLQAGAYSAMPPMTAVTGTFHNDGSVEVNATVTAQVKRSATETFTESATAAFPAGQDTTVTVKVPGVQYQPYCVCTIYVEGNCLTCGGTGYVSTVVTCPDCGGTGVASEIGGTTGGTGGSSSSGGRTSSGTTSTTGDFNLGGVGGIVGGVVAAGAVVAVGFVVVKKRRVTEQSLRRLSSFEFQDWAVKRMYANPSSQKDAYLGIDAYTAEGYPVQIRQDNDVGKRAIDSFAAAMARNKQRTGTIVAFGFGNDAAEGVMRARLNYRLEIKTVTVKELLLNKTRTY